MPRSPMRVYEAMRGSTVKKGGEGNRENGRSGDGNQEQIWRRKSGRIKADDLHRCMIGDNAALRPCGVTRAAS